MMCDGLRSSATGAFANARRSAAQIYLGEPEYSRSALADYQAQQAARIQPSNQSAVARPSTRRVRREFHRRPRAGIARRFQCAITRHSFWIVVLEIGIGGPLP